MRNKFFLLLILLTTKVFADTTSVAGDSTVKPFVPPNNGPLGIDNVTGIALFGAAILFAILILVLWRKNIMKSK